MAVTTTKTNKPINPRGNDQSPKGYNRAELYTGKALDFDGVNDEVDLGTGVLTGTGDFTYCGYVKSDGTQNGSSIFANYPAGNLQVIYGKRFIGFYLGNNSTYLGTSPWNVDLEEFTTDWVFLTALREGTETRFYMNGVLMKTGSSSSTIGDSSDSFKLGTATNGNERFDGKIANSRAFNVALTEAQILDLYNNPEKVVPTGVDNTALKLWLPMQEGAGTTAYDGSGNGNHGTISGATWTHGIGAPVSQTAVIDWNKGQNELQYSEAFDNAFWTKSRTTITANDTTAPDGSANADKLEITTSGGNNELYRYVGTIAIGHALSVYVKKDTARWFALGTNVQTTKMVWFDLDNGVVGTEATGYTGVMTDEGDGWYRCGVIIGAGASTSTYIDMSLSNSDGVLGGNVGLSVFIWGAQVEQADAVGSYIPTFATAQTSEVLLPQGLTSGRDITGVNLFENVRKQGALNLDGNSWAEVHDNASLDISGEITIEAWARVSYVNSGSSLNCILTLGNGMTASDTAAFGTTSGPIPIFYYRSGGQTGSALTEGDWVHFVGVYVGTTAKLYINATQVSSNVRTSGSMSNDKNIFIGRDDTTLNRNYNDQIAQPRIYNRALTAEEVQTNYDKGKDIFTN